MANKKVFVRWLKFLLVLCFIHVFARINVSNKICWVNHLQVAWESGFYFQFTIFQTLVEIVKVARMYMYKLDYFFQLLLLIFKLLLDLLAVAKPEPVITNTNLKWFLRYSLHKAAFNLKFQFFALLFSLVHLLHAFKECFYVFTDLTIFFKYCLFVKFVCLLVLKLFL